MDKNDNAAGAAIALTSLNSKTTPPTERVLTTLPQQQDCPIASTFRSPSNATTTTASSLPITPANTRATSTSTPALSRPASEVKVAANSTRVTEKEKGSENGTESELTQKAMEHKLVKKLDWCLFPCLIGMCMFQAADRGAISIAQINGIEEDLSITQSQFNFAISIFQVGYCLFQLPSNLVIAHPKVHPGIYLSFACLGWSLVALCHAFAKNYAQLLAVRFLLGVFDAPYAVGTFYLLSCWYTKKEMATRLALLLVGYIMTMLGVGPAAVGILRGLAGVNGWMGWRWVYVVFGSLGAGVSVWGLWMLPGETSRADGRKVWWLTEAEYEFARVRIEEDRVGEKKVEKRKIWTGFKDAVKDLRMWVFVVMMLSRKSFEGLWTYELSILKSLHLGNGSGASEDTTALLLAIGPAAFAGIVTLLVARSSDRRAERSWHLVGPLIFAGVGLNVCAITLDSVTRYIMLFLCEAGGASGIALTWAWITSTIQETPEKRAVAIAIVNVVGGLGAIYSPFLFRSRDKPGYRMAFGMLAGFVVVDVVCIFAMRWLLKNANRVLKENETSEGKVGEGNMYIL